MSWNVWSNRLVAGGSWGSAEPIDDATTDAGGFGQVVADGAGNALALWAQGGDAWANRYTAGIGWGTADVIETSESGGASTGDLGASADGDATAVWPQSDGTRANIWANRFVAGSWQTAALIETNNTGGATGPKIAVNDRGDAAVVWVQSNGTRDDIWANRYIAGAGWQMAREIESNNAGNAGLPQVAIDPAGNVVAVWYQSDGTRHSVWANRCVAGGDWGTATELDTSSNHAYGPLVAIDEGGNATVIWQQDDGSPRYNTWANTFEER
jgi:hypothetical protein